MRGELDYQAMWFGCNRKKQSENAVNLQDCRFSFLQQGKFGSLSTGPVSAGLEEVLGKELHKNVFLPGK